MTKTRWLNDAEMRFWRAFVEVSSGVVQRVEADLKADANLDFDDYEVLVHLSEADDRRLRMSVLSERLLNSRSRLTQRIDRMVDRGLVRREKCAEDGRGTFAVLTDEGFATIESAAPDHVRSVREHLIDLVDPGELDMAVDVYERVTKGLRSS
ncbi:MAG: MarR family transcriptional regulator [Acidimicrobiia bacterium]|nr:MarR family transcriptional regulator [Acidimicrobiia bacterium]